MQHLMHTADEQENDLVIGLAGAKVIFLMTRKRRNEMFHLPPAIKLQRESKTTASLLCSLAAFKKLTEFEQDHGGDIGWPIWS
jgi:predicted nuclease of restriction endonuclease-like RecB superfamily